MVGIIVGKLDGYCEGQFVGNTVCGIDGEALGEMGSDDVRKNVGAGVGDLVGKLAELQA